MEALRSYKVFLLLTKAYARHLGNLQKSIPNLYGALRRSRIFATKGVIYIKQTNLLFRRMMPVSLDAFMHQLLIVTHLMMYPFSTMFNTRD